MKTRKPTFERRAIERLPTTFDDLIQLHAPRPIHDEVGYKNTVEMVDALAGHRLNKDQEDYLLLLSALVERYEADTLPKRSRASGLDMLRYLLDENELRGDDLAKILGVDRSVAYRILKAERGLTTEHIKLLCERFGVPADLLIR
ncbi:MAG: helix-turn-helix domain-containing protein [Opitutaceae bacterium]|nr:helix-turn-helix domain-containing protein [Opitutaceae bacterium]